METNAFGPQGGKGPPSLHENSEVKFCICNGGPQVDGGSAHGTVGFSGTRTHSVMFRLLCCDHGEWQGPKCAKHICICVQICFPNENENSSIEVPPWSTGDMFQGIPRVPDSVGNIRSRMCCVLDLCSDLRV